MASISTDTKWQESEFSGFFKPKDFLRAAGFAVVGKRVEIRSGTVYKHPDLQQDSPQLIADVYVFRSEADAREGKPSERFENIAIGQTALMAPWAKVDFGPKQNAGFDSNGQAITWRNALKIRVGASERKLPLGTFMAPAVVSQPDRAWEWDTEDMSVEAKAGIVKFIEGLPDPEGVVDDKAYAPRPAPTGGGKLQAATPEPAQAALDTDDCPF